MPQIINSSGPPVPAAKSPRFMRAILETRCAHAGCEKMLVFVYMRVRWPERVFGSRGSQHV